MGNRSEFIRKGILLRGVIAEHIEKRNYDAAKMILMEYIEDYSYDINWCLLKAAFEGAAGNYQEAKDILTRKYPQHEWNFDLNYNLGLYCYQLDEFERSVRYFMRCMLHEKITDEIGEVIESKIEEMCIKDIKVLDYYIFYGNQEQQTRDCAPCGFPGKFTLIGENVVRESYIGDKFVLDGKEYYCGIYDRYFEERQGYPLYKKGNKSWMLYKTEIFQGQKVRNFQYFAKEKMLIALMPLKKKQKITIIAGEIVLNMNELLDNRYYYYTFEKGTQIQITSKTDFVVSEPAVLTCDPQRPRLILNLFVDGLSQKYLDEVGLKNVMPNTYSFFQKGTIFKNAYTNAEWTYPSLAGTFSGRHTLGEAGHRIFHTSCCSQNLYEMELFPEILHKNGYFCSKIDGDWRVTPTLGYGKGMDRMLYQPSILDMFSDRVIMDMVEHLETFKERNNFIWLEFPDLHDVPDEFESAISTQKETDIQYRKIEHTEGTSVKRAYSETKVKRYSALLKRIDVYLGMLYSYIEQNYKDDEFIVSLMSDHGQGYFSSENKEFFNEYRNKIAMMYRGHNIPKGCCEELTEIVDLFPSLLHCAGIGDFDSKEGNIPKWFGGNKEKEYVISETIFPGSIYCASITDKKYSFYFSGTRPCTDEGYLDMTGFTTRLVETDTQKDVTSEKPEIVDRFTDIMLEHIQQYIINI